MEMERLYDALRKADAAGDVESARKLSAYIREQRIKEVNRAEAQDRAMGQAGIEEQLGWLYDPSKGLNDFWARFDLARTVSPEDRQRKLQAKMPDADVRTVSHQPDPDLPAKPITVFRRPDEETFHPVGGGGLTGLAGAGLGSLTNMEAAGAIGGALLTRGVGLPLRMGAQAVGGFFGRGADEGIEKLRGFNESDPEDIFGRMALSGGMGVAGEGAGSLLHRVVSGPFRGGMIQPTPGTKMAQQATEQEGLPKLTLGQMHPILQRKENQLAMTTDPVHLRRGQQRASVRDAQTRLRDTISGQPGAEPRFSEADLDRTVRTIGRELDLTVRNPRVSMQDGGRGLQEGLEEFRGLSQNWVSNKYDKALQYADDVTFDLSDTVAAMERIRRGHPMAGARPGQSPILGPDGQPQIRMEPVPVRAEGSIHGDLLNIMRDIELLANAPQEGRAAAEGMIALRGRLRGLLDQNYTMADAQTRSAMREGQSLYAALTDAMENPIADNSTFSSLWKAANTSNAWREGILSTGDAIRIANTDSPEKLLRFAAPGNATTLRTLRRVLPEDRWQQYQEGYMTQLLSEPESIVRHMDAFRRDPDTLAMLVPPREQQALRAFGHSSEQLRRFDSVLRQQTNDGERLIKMLDTITPDQMGTLLQQAGGPTSPQGQTLRAGVVQAILDRTETYDQKIGRMVADPNKVGVIDSYLNNPSLRSFLQPTERTSLENYATALRHYGGAGDVGAGIAGAETASAVADLRRGIPWMAWLKQSSAAAYARMFVMPGMSDFIFGVGTPLGPSAFKDALRAGATANFMLYRNLSDQYQSGAFETGEDQQ